MGFGSRQDKDNVWWWLFQRLQEGIGGAGTEHMDFVYDIDLVTGFTGSIVSSLAEVPDIVNAGVAGGINLYDIQSPALGYCLAHGAGITRFTLAIGKTIHRLGQDAPGAGLTCSSWTTKKIGMRYTTSIKGIA